MKTILQAETVFDPNFEIRFRPLLKVGSDSLLSVVPNDEASLQAFFDKAVSSGQLSLPWPINQATPQEWQELIDRNLPADLWQELSEEERRVEALRIYRDLTNGAGGWDDAP